MLMTAEQGNLSTTLGQAQQAAPLPASAQKWCMVLVRPSLEQEARDSLRRRGIGAWWPNYPREVIRKDQRSGRREKHLVLSSVVAGILLSPAQRDDRFYAAMDLAPGVINMARIGSEAVLLTDTDIVLIHKIEEGLNKGLSAKAIHSFKVGDKVRFIDDVVRRWPSGKIIKCARDGHIEVEVYILGRMVTVTVLPHQIEKC